MYGIFHRARQTGDNDSFCGVLDTEDTCRDTYDDYCDDEQYARNIQGLRKKVR